MYKRLTIFFVILLIASTSRAQIVPYYGKNNVKYDTFDWKTYKTTHFDIYFYPASQPHLERVASMAESAYDEISSRLQHDIEFRIPLIFFKTQSEFEQVNYLNIVEGILGAAEPVYNRMAFAIDQPSDKLQRLITHELTHVFEFSLLFGGMLSPMVRQSPPLWVMEGFAEFQTGVWDPADLMVVRDAVLTERMPYLSVAEDMIMPGGTELSRAPYTIGHAAFEFISEKYGESAVRQFWFYMKKATLLGTEDVIFSALGIKEEVFNEQFSQYLRDRFRPFRDKQSPIDYGKEITLPRKYNQIFSQAPAPGGKEFAILTANREDFEFDILKIDQTGKILDNLTGGLTTSYDYLTTDSFTFEGRNLSWSSDGSRIAFFARTGKRRSLFIINARSGERIQKIKLKIDQAASPSISPDGRWVAITGFEGGQPDLFLIDLKTEKVQRLTNNILLEKTPMWSPDGRWIFYTTRIHSRDQIMRLDAANPEKVEQLTFSDYNSTSPYYDPETNSVYYAGDKENAFNLYRLDLNTGDKYQYTDVIGGNFSPVVFRDQGKEKIAFTSFFKGQYRLFIMDLPEPIRVIAAGSETQGGEVLAKSAEQATQQVLEGTTPESGKGGSREFPRQGPVLTDFHPARTVSIDERKIEDKKMKLIIGGRPNVITGVSGDTFAVASGVVLQDILGDQEIRIFTSRIRGFQSYNVGYLDLGHRLQFLTDFIFNDDFFFAPVPTEIALQTGFTFDIVRSRIYGGRFLSQYPMSRYYRFEMGAGIFDLSQKFLDPVVQRLYEDLIRRQGARDFLSVGGYFPLSFAVVGETTRFREFGPIAGHTFRISVDYSPPLTEEWVSRTIYEADLRKYFRISNRSLMATRVRGFYTGGRDPVIFSFGGGQDVRGYDFREIAGHRGGIANVEYRFPLYPNPRIPFLGQLRGKIFVDYFRVDFTNNKEQRFVIPRAAIIARRVEGRSFAMFLNEGAGSIGAGFTVFAGGLPLNFNFSKNYGYGRFARESGFVFPTDPLEFKFTDGIEFDFSIGYDF